MSKSASPALFGGVRLAGEPDLENIRLLDSLAIPQLNRMTRYGIRIDPDYLLALGAEFGREMAGLQQQISSYIPPDALDRFSATAAAIEDSDGTAAMNPNSAEQIRVLLYDLLAVGGMKEIKLTSTGKKTTGKKQLELLRDDHPIVALVLDYRERSKLKSAFCDSLPLKARLHPRGPSCPVCELSHVESTWRVHPEFPTTRTETGRIASRGPNCQQIPQRSVLGERIRAGFLASPGTRLVSVDFSQIELRDLAHLANAASMIEVYARDGDIHVYTACQCFGRDESRMTRLLALDKTALTAAEAEEVHYFKLYERMPSKNLNFMTCYGATPKGLQAQLALSQVYWTEEQCAEFQNERWFGVYPEVRAYMSLQEYRARRYGFVWDPFGRVRRTPERLSVHPYIRSAGIRQAGNMPIQSCSAAQIKLAMAECEDLFVSLLSDRVFAWPLLSIHDQIVAEVDERYAREVGDLIADIFANVMIDKDTGEDLWRVPIRAEPEIMERWQKL